jgi:hypothetical protein
VHDALSRRDVNDLRPRFGSKQRFVARSASAVERAEIGDVATPQVDPLVRVGGSNEVVEKMAASGEAQEIVGGAREVVVDRFADELPRAPQRGTERVVHGALQHELEREPIANQLNQGDADEDGGKGEPSAEKTRPRAHLDGGERLHEKQHERHADDTGDRAEIERTGDGPPDSIGHGALHAGEAAV